MTILSKAVKLATVWHEGQIRKYTREPYITHPLAVASELMALGFDEEVLAAAVLHDTVEDCGVTHEKIEAEFGPWVSRLVWEVTDASKPEDGNRAARKRLDLEHLKLASFEGKSIKLADIKQNVPSILLHDPNFGPVYLREKSESLEVLRDGHPKLVKDVEFILSSWERPKESKLEHRVCSFVRNNSKCSLCEGDCLTLSIARAIIKEVELDSSARVPDETGRLQAIIRVNALRAGFTHSDVDEVINGRVDESV